MTIKRGGFKRNGGDKPDTLPAKVPTPERLLEMVEPRQLLDAALVAFGAWVAAGFFIAFLFAAKILSDDIISPEGGPHPGKVRVVEDMGPAKILLVDVSGCAIHILVPASDNVRPGDEVRPRVDPERVVLWPADSQRRCGMDGAARDRGLCRP